MRLSNRSEKYLRALVALLVLISIMIGIPNGPIQASATNNDETLHILSLTDSYGAGIGVKPEAGTDDCQKGSNSQVREVERRLESKGWKVEVNDIASCMGYVIDDLLDFVATSQGKAAVKKADLIFIRVGGNDVGFAPRIGCIALALPNLTAGCLNDWLNPITDTSGHAGNQLTLLLQEIAGLSEGKTEVIVDNYPFLFAEPESWDNLNPACITLNSLLLFGSSFPGMISLTELLNSEIRRAVNKVDGANDVSISLMDIRSMYSDHGICGGGEDWINLAVAHPHWFHPTPRAYLEEAGVLEMMVGHRFNKRDFDGRNAVEIAWGPYIGDIIKYNNGERTSWYVTATGLKHIPTSNDFNCFESKGSKVHLLNVAFVDSLPRVSGDATCTNTPVEPQGEHVYGDLPLACGTEIPYASTYDTYSGFFHGHALDMPASAGTVVVAPVSGTVAVKYDANGYGNYIDLTESNGTVHRFAHMQGIELAANGSQVKQSDKLGLVGSTGASTGPHLHYERRVNGAQVPIMLDGAALQWGPRYRTGGDRTTTHKLISGNCKPQSQQPSELRVGALGTDNCLHVKEGALNGTWVKQLCGVVSFELEKDRIAVLTNAGGLHVKQGGLHAPWVWQASHVVDFDLEGDRIGIVSNAGRSYVKQGSLSAKWTQVHSNTKDIQLNGVRIAVLQTNGDLLIKTPYISSKWVKLYSNVDSFTLAYQRVIARQTNGYLIAKSGSISAPWVMLMNSSVDSFMATSRRIGMEIDGRLWVKDGALDAPWQELASGVEHYDITQYRVLQSGNDLIRVKEPRLWSPWVNLMDAQVQYVDAEASYIGFVSGSGMFYAKWPKSNSPWVRMLDGVRIIEFETW